MLEPLNLTLGHGLAKLWMIIVFEIEEINFEG